VLREAEAILGPLPLDAKVSVPLEVAPFMTNMVANSHRVAATALGPLIAPGSHFLELLIVIQDGSFITLRLPDAIQRVLSGPSFGVSEVMLVEQSRPELIWHVDIILGVNTVFSGRWRAFALSHHLHVGGCLVFHFRLGVLEASVRIFNANGVCHTYPVPAAME
jgi:hypothetical protein